MTHHIEVTEKQIRTPFFTKLVQYATFFSNIRLQRCLKLGNLKFQWFLPCPPLSFLLQIKSAADQLLICLFQNLTFTLEFSEPMFSLKTADYSLTYFKCWNGWLVFNGTFSTKNLYHAIWELCVKTAVIGWSWWGWTETVKKKLKIYWKQVVSIIRIETICGPPQLLLSFTMPTVLQSIRGLTVDF